jgi:TMEM175 potassium channel family protein
MSKGRLEAFSDGVLAIILTIMVLELKVPEDGTLAALRPLLPKFLSYILSFVFLGIYWNNHHHLWQAAKNVNGAILWANLHLLFWLSLIPFVTGWMGEHFSAVPVAFYGGVLWCAAMAYYIMVRAMLAHHGQDSLLAAAIGDKKKEMLSLYIYTAAILLAFLADWLATLLYVVVAIMWLVPDRRIETRLKR